MIGNDVVDWYIGNILEDVKDMVRIAIVGMMNTKCSILPAPVGHNSADEARMICRLKHLNR